MGTHPENKIKALKMAIVALKMTPCPHGEWPSVTVLRKMIQELKDEPT